MNRNVKKEDRKPDDIHQSYLNLKYLKDIPKYILICMDI